MSTTDAMCVYSCYKKRAEVTLGPFVVAGSAWLLCEVHLTRVGDNFSAARDVARGRHVAVCVARCEVASGSHAPLGWVVIDVDDLTYCYECLVDKRGFENFVKSHSGSSKLKDSEASWVELLAVCNSVR